MAIKSLFGEGGGLAPKKALKNPNMYRESIIYDAISRLPRKKIDEFCNSKEAKVMMSEGYLSQETLERLTNEHGIPGVVKTIACHMARENEDPEFAKFVNGNRTAHEALDAILAKYSSDAADIAENYQKDIDSIIPEYFKK